MTRLKERYINEVTKVLQAKFGYANVMEIPKVERIVINMGVSDAVADPKALDSAVRDLALISGQKPQITRAKKSISNFKVRAGMPIGCKVTLRGERMDYFLDKLMNVSLARIRDFRGLSRNGFDGRGNYTLGIKEQVIFPEIRADKIDKVRGMDITIVTSAGTDEEAYELLKALGMPFAS
jgi:large subunit ribosomal protein L5